MQNDERRIAVFIDFENVAMGVRESKYGNFNIDLVLKRLVEKGKIMVKRAYSDWHRYVEFKRAFHQAAIELIDVPQTRYSGKNSADIRMVVDALDLSYQKEHIDTFVLVSGDSDFSPLVSKLRENGRYVIGMGVKQSSSDLLVNNCDEFIYYEDLVRPTTGGPGSDPRLRNLPAKRAEALRLVLETFDALQREGKESIYGSMIKQTLIRKLPSFSENYFGYPTFSRLLEDAAENKLLKLIKDQKSGGYIVTAVTETNGQSMAATAVGGEAGLETPAAKEATAIGATGTISASPVEAHDFRRRSRWGRTRWGRGASRPSEPSQTTQIVPTQPESSTPEAPLAPSAPPEPQEAGVLTSTSDEFLAPVITETAGLRDNSGLAAQASQGGGSVAVIEPEHRSRGGRGRRGKGPQRASHPSHSPREVAQRTPSLFQKAPASPAPSASEETSGGLSAKNAQEAQGPPGPPVITSSSEEIPQAPASLASETAVPVSSKQPSSSEASRHPGRRRARGRKPAGRTPRNK